LTPVPDPNSVSHKNYNLAEAFFPIMLINRVQRFWAAFFIAVLITWLGVWFGAPVQAHPPQDNPLPKFTLKDPCALDPKNLIYNGSMSAGGPADGWSTFVLNGSPDFHHVDNEQIDPNGAVQIVSSGKFDAGIMQTVHNLQPGTFYGFRLGYSLAAKSYSGPNVRVDSIGRKVGADPFGGTDPKSPNVVWGPDYFDGQGALNRPEMQLVFAARSPNVTIFLRGMARDDAEGENRIWLDAVCMQAQNDMPTATPAAPTVAAVPTAAPTAVPSPTKAAVAKPPPTNVPPTVTRTPTQTSTPTKVPTATPIPTARFARPIAEAEPDGLPILNSNLLSGVGVGSIFSSFVMFAIGIVLVRR
jgi:hypothetical protein